MINYVPGFSGYLNRLAGGPGFAEALPAEMPIYAEPAPQPVYDQPIYPAPVYLPPMYTSPVYDQPVYAEPAPQPVYAEPAPQPVYVEPAPQPVYAEPVYTEPAPQPVYDQPVYAEPAPQPVYAEPVHTEPTYVPGFSGHLERLSGGPGFSEALPETVAIPEATYAEPAPVYAPPTPQPVQEVPYVEPSYYAEPSYSLPTEQPVIAEPYYEAPSYSLPTAQPVYSEPFLGGLSAPTLSEQPVSEAQPYSYTPTETAPIDLGGWDPSMINLNGLNVLSDPGPAYDPNSIFYFHTGHDIGVPNASGGFDYRGAHPIHYEAGQTYRMFDKKGNVVGTASSPAEMQALVEKSKSLPAYTMELVGNQYGTTLPSGGWLPSKTDAGSLGSLLVNMAALALPAVGGAVLGPVLAGALGSSAAVGTGLGTAAGSAAAGTAAGKSIGDILKSAALSGVTAGALQGIMPAGPSGTPVNTAHTGIANAIGGGASNAITVLGNLASSAAPSVAGGITNALTSAASNNYAPEPAPPPPAGGYGDIVVSGTPSANLAAGPGAIAPGFPSTLEGALSAAQPGPVNYADQQIVVEAQRPAPPPEPAAPPAPVGGLEAAFDAAFPRDQIVVEAQRPAPPPEPAAPLPVYAPPSGGPATQPIDEIVVEGAREPYTQPDYVAPPATLITPPGTGGSLAPDTTLTQPIDSALPKSGPSLQDIVDYLRLAGLGTSLLGGLFGGKGDQQANRAISGTMGGLNPTFSAKLPGANIPGLGGGAASTPRTAADLSQQGLKTAQDWYRYGYGPEQSFFNYVPQSSPNTSKAYTGYAEGGFAVKGPGDGREDKIPAMLSDGEYVIDAETVALLGNGSNKAGADVLDQFRVNVRKHKGRELARGGFSVNAKRPEQYMAGGRA